MITNNLLIKLKNREDEAVNKAKSVLLGMKGKIDVLIDVEVHTDIRREASSYDVMLVTKFASPKDMDAYLAHPVHVEVSEYILSVIASAAAVCYES